MMWALLQLLLAQDVPTDPTSFGTIEPPPGVVDYNKLVESQGGTIGIFIFAQYAVNLFAAGCGLYVFVNFLLAGYTFISSQGESKAYTQVRDRILNSVVGLMLIVGAYTITALVGYIFFGDPSYILNPQIKGPLPATGGA